MASNGRSLAELLASVEKKKHDDIRERIGLPITLKADPIQLEALGYLLMERSGPVRVLLEGDAIRVGEPRSSGGLLIRGAAATFLLSKWSISRAEIPAEGIIFELNHGIRI